MPLPSRPLPQLEAGVDEARLHPQYARLPALVRGAWLPTREAAGGRALHPGLLLRLLLGNGCRSCRQLRCSHTVCCACRLARPA